MAAFVNAAAMLLYHRNHVILTPLPPEACAGFDSQSFALHTDRIVNTVA